MKYTQQPCLLRASPRLSTYSMPPRNSLDEDTIERVARNALQTKTIDIERVDDYLFDTFRLQASSPSFFYMLKCPRTENASLLQQEAGRLVAEAQVLQALQEQQLLPQLPRLIAFDNTTSPLAGSCLITGPFQGSVLASVEHSMPPDAAERVERSIGQYVRQLAATSGPFFGPVGSSAPGPSAWPSYFQTMVQLLLQDGEDALLSLPYDVVREQVRKHHASLAKITEPQLLVLELANAKDVLVDTQSACLSGLLDFSTAIWGDPGICDCFYQPSAAILDGFGSRLDSNVDEQVRQCLYAVYHSLLAVVRSSYRPSESNDELAARRSLTTALSQLASFDR